MTPEQAIADLDADLKEHGQPVTLQRFVNGPGSTRIHTEVKTKAFLIGYLPQELTQEITQQDVKVIMSPTDINRAQWPGPTPPPGIGDARIPVKLDRIVTAQGTLAVQVGDGTYFGTTLVRIEVRARG